MSVPKRMNVPVRMDAPPSPTMFPHTVTLFTTRTESGEGFKDITVNYVTILRGVLCDDSKASNVRASGLEGADAVNLIVPFGVEAIDPADIDKKNPPIKKYVGPIEFWRLDDKSGYWTLTTGQDTYFVKGVAIPYKSWKPEIVHDMINALYDDVYNVTKVDVKDFGELQHFEIGGA